MRKVFLHIPKCGGNSIEAKFRRNGISYTRIEPDTPIENVPDGIITGHISFNKLERDATARFFTVLRSPISRAMSHYYYCFAHKENNPEYPYIKDMSVEEFLDKYIPDNYMARLLIGDKWFDNEISNEVRFDMCISTINERYMAIGKMEYVICFDSWLTREFGGSVIVAHENKNEHDDSVSVEARLKFLKSNVVDYMLYEYIGNFWENKNLGK